MTWQDISTVRAKAPYEGVRSAEPQLVTLFGPGGSDAPSVRVPNGATLMLGRGGGGGAATAFAADPKVSRNHAELRRDPETGEVEVVDLSANGTWVDGERIARAPLRDGAVLRIGDTFLLLRYFGGDPRNATVEGLVGRSPLMKALRHDIIRVAAEDACVLLSGESGTGKELVAQCIHRTSGRRGAFVPVNCAAIPEAVAESLLFGHVAGAVSGAHGDHDGYFRTASGGTLFLDEVGELPAALQAKLMRALKTKAICPVGASLPVPVNVRVILATHRDLSEEVGAGNFLAELHASISELSLTVPALRDRREDILPLLRLALGDEVDSLPTDIIHALLVDPWPYNVRELFAVAKRMRILGARDGSADLAYFRTRRSSPPSHAPAPGSLRPASTPPRDAPPSKERVIEVVTRLSGNIRRAAEELGRSRKQVYRYVEHYGVDLEALRRSH